MTTTLKLAYNTTDSPILVDEAGYVIGGRSWGPVDANDVRALAEYDAGRLVDANEEALTASGNPDAIDAVRALHDRRARYEAAQALDKDELIEALDPEVIDDLPVGGDGKPAKDDLVEVAAAGDAPLPEATKKTTSRPRGQK